VRASPSCLTTKTITTTLWSASLQGMVRGQPQFLTGGRARERRRRRRSGETPEPTVTVRMGEGAPIDAKSDLCPVWA
jgi:hypothetical protein